jgi:heme exporter protein A
MKLAVENLTVERGGRRILSDIAFTLEAGEALLLTGPNGAGKTTLLKTLAGFIAPADGRIVLTGGDAEAPVAEQAHVMGHANGIRPVLTVEENAQFWAGYLDRPARLLEDVLDRFGLIGLAQVPAAYLSAGQKRRLGLTRLLLVKRPLWLLDEPTAALDAAAAALVGEIIDEHTAGGGIAVVATHAPVPLARAKTLELGGAASP